MIYTNNLLKSPRILWTLPDRLQYFDHGEGVAFAVFEEVAADGGFFFVAGGGECALEPAEAGEAAFLDVFEVFVGEFGEKGGKDAFEGGAAVESGVNVPAVFFEDVHEVVNSCVDGFEVFFVFGVERGHFFVAGHFKRFVPDDHGPAFKRDLGLQGFEEFGNGVLFSVGEEFEMFEFGFW